MGVTREFATLIGTSLRELNKLGHAAGFIFLLATIALWFRTGPQTRRLLTIELLFIVLMIGATMYVQSSIVPAMEHDRAVAGGDITSVPPTIRRESTSTTCTRCRKKSKARLYSSASEWC